MLDASHVAVRHDDMLDTMTQILVLHNITRPQQRFLNWSLGLFISYHIVENRESSMRSTTDDQCS